MHELLIGIWQTHRFTIILITHDVAEAVSLARSSDTLARAGYVAAAVNHLVTMSATRPASFVRTPHAR
jgi:ABC-type nitrate/sulfonate/bicarbonate transport system ATPase subunit